ncbi:hypothetical protein BDV96DRAFT_168155 [Lophiotrema nucula]|uniref:SP-RING-type domain-containing protein n=1 Tax=Lophiotrema nucula TaxID=690887 RepID=A0A6A5YXZ4_9PLEO|nr:hypothetical protein BDV96DRAFT_168155 [Lophiotrema nucula]
MPVGGRPPAAPHPQRDPHVLAREAQAQQNTLNFQLGNLGGRQKSWMYGNSTAITGNAARPTASRAPNPPMRSQTDPQRRPPQPPASPVTEDGYDRGPPSNSTSPQLANVVSDQGRRFSHNSNVFPSPAPSDDVVLETHNLQDTESASFVNTHNQAVDIDGYSAVGAALFAELGQDEDMRARNKRPAENTTPMTQKKKRGRVASGKSPSLQSNPATTTIPNTASSSSDFTNTELHNPARVVSDSVLPSRSSLFEAAARGQGSGEQVQPTAQSRPQTAVPAGTTPPQGQEPFGPSRPLSSNFILESNATPTRGSPVINSPVVSLVQSSPEYYTAVDCWGAIRRFRSSFRPTNVHERDSQRLGTLELAVQKEDWAYLTFHQYYCLLSHDRALVTSKLLNHPHLPHAVRMLEDVLDSNSCLCPSTLEFFANFPFPLTHISINWPQNYAREQEAFHDFIVRSINYNALQHSCQRLKRPPVMLELYHDLAIRSVTLQTVVFMSILRRNWSTGTTQPLKQRAFETRAQFLLEQNQQDFMHRKHLWTADTILQERATDQKTWGEKYYQLCLSHESWLRSYSAIQSSPNSGQSIQNPAQAQALTAQPAELRRDSGQSQAQTSPTIQHQHETPMLSTQVGGASRGPEPHHLQGSTNVQQQQALPSPATASPTTEARRGPGRPRIYPQAQAQQADSQRGSGELPQVHSYAILQVPRQELLLQRNDQQLQIQQRQVQHAQARPRQVQPPQRGQQQVTALTWQQPTQEAHVQEQHSGRTQAQQRQNQHAPVLPQQQAQMSPPPQQQIQPAQVQQQQVQQAPPLQQQAGTAPAPQQQFQQPQPPKQDPRKLMPPPGLYRSQQTQPNPVVSALHQAGLRSPTLRAQGSESNLLQYVKKLATPPTPLKVAGHQVETWKLPRFDLNTIPVTADGAFGAYSTRSVNEKHQLYRLRCIKWPHDAESPNENVWAVSDTCWPSLSYFTLNKNDHLHQRKKLNYGKDLPIDISSLVHDGDNMLDISVLCSSRDLTWRNYRLAIEVVGFKRPESIKEECLSARVIPLTHILDKIKAKLSSNNDDEVSIVQSNVTINLVDPFSASQICDIPVRSAACLHFDCFDLDIFLQTRMSKGNDEASMADHWKCPICNGDARPHLLVVDGFLQKVRRTLAQHSLLNTRAIIVGQDGSWKPKVETRDMSARDTPEQSEPASPRSSAPAAGSRPFSAASAAAKEVEVIDLSD